MCSMLFSDICRFVVVIGSGRFMCNCCVLDVGLFNGVGSFRVMFCSVELMFKVWCYGVF